ncbi:MAG: hypothetical protein QOK42_2814 [Frankiaceae bacterium]|jgi:hypothetical protein|nr:hypothetical protein [Frankiaceae bacterium]MDX6225284.1 hypothetical protein [Frankiales bacterium]MDX6275099.1 hypothetical protein [Frankiales bacterium]
MAATVCARCGHENAPGSRFCASCGAPFENASETTSTISLTGIEALDPSEAADSALPDDAAVEQLPAGSALLLVRRGPSAGARFLLDSDVTTAGRHPDSDIFLDDVTVSRRHAEFLRRDNGFAVRDAGSLNGTYRNRERIDEAVLSDGDEVQVGKFRLVFFGSPKTAAGE